MLFKSFVEAYTGNKNPEHRFSPIYYISQLIIYILTANVNKDIH
jgi:hypothetical protein